MVVCEGAYLDQRPAMPSNYSEAPRKSPSRPVSRGSSVLAKLYSIKSVRIMVWMSGKFRQPSSFVTANVAMPNPVHEEDGLQFGIHRTLQ